MRSSMPAPYWVSYKAMVQLAEERTSDSSTTIAAISRSTGTIAGSHHHRDQTDDLQRSLQSTGSVYPQ